ncbi:hypothetical protein VKT23_017658 [Stygiomarasmius scandens]|uniref:Uncharacterized protein n=1 Tax=Marasmiellus scandens TaxID=2682957 RepID=A0ABR1IUQ9_9AGAR
MSPRPTNLELVPSDIPQYHSLPGSFHPVRVIMLRRGRELDESYEPCFIGTYPPMGMWDASYDEARSCWEMQDAKWNIFGRASGAGGVMFEDWTLVICPRLCPPCNKACIGTTSPVCTI